MKIKNSDPEIGSATHLLNASSSISNYFCRNIFTRVDKISNPQTKPVFLEKCLSRFELPTKILKIMYHESSWCHENRPVYKELTENFHIESKGARTTADFNPFVRLFTDKGIITLHVLAVGDWEITVNVPDNYGDYIITAGLLTKNLSLKLSPGERIELPNIIVHEFPSDDENECNKEFQKYLNDLLLSNNKVSLPIVYNSWFYDFDKFFVKDLKKQAVAAKELGAEVFIVDAGWYGPSNDDWSKATGDWREKKNGAFYGKMRNFANYIRSIGMEFGLWIEVEKICAGTPVIEKHPKWFIEASEGIFYPDLMKRGAYGYIYKVISSLIDKYEVKWIKIDFNFPLANDPSKSNYFRYMHNFYKLIDTLQTDYPHTVFEACQSGAMRADLETMKHFDTQFLSDTVKPSEMIEIYKNALCRTSPSLLYKWIVLRQIQNVPRYGVPLKESGGALIVPSGPTWNTFECCHISTICNLVFLGSLGFSGDLSGLTEKNKKLLTQHIDIYKEYLNDLPSTSICLEVNEPGWTVFRIDNIKATIEVAFRNYGSSTKCLLPDCEFEMPDTDYACHRLTTKST